MSKETREHLSALVDGEISADTSRFLVRRLGSDVELRATWARYHLVRDCLRHQEGEIAHDDLCARVSEAIENESPARRGAPVAKRWLKPVTGMAIAASVALMAITAVGPGMLGTAVPTGEVAEGGAVQQFTSPQGFQGSNRPITNQASLSGAPSGSDRSMDAYLLRHYQASGAAGAKGFVTYVPIVIIGSKIPAEAEQASEAAEKTSDKEEESSSR